MVLYVHLLWLYATDIHDIQYVSKWCCVIWSYKGCILYLSTDRARFRRKYYIMNANLLYPKCQIDSFVGFASQWYWFLICGTCSWEVYSSHIYEWKTSLTNTTSPFPGRTWMNAHYCWYCLEGRNISQNVVDRQFETIHLYNRCVLSIWSFVK